MRLKHLDTFLVALLGMAAVLILTQHGGVGISPDSIYYISAAHSVKEGHGFMQFDDTPFVLFPLVFPSFLVLVELISGKDIVLMAPYINALLFGVTIFLSGTMLERMNLSKIVKWILLLLIALSPGLLEIYTMLWSEALFITEIIIFIWVCFYYFKNSKLKNLILLSLIAAIAADTRLAGVTVIAAGGLLIILSHDSKGWQKWKHIIIYSLISFSLLVINLVRNFLVSTSFTGARQKGDTSFLTNVKYFGDVLGGWLMLAVFPHFNFLGLGIIFIISFSSIFVYRYIKNIEHNSFEKIAACFTLVYSIFMLLSATFSKYETINNRLLAPFFIPLLFTIGFYVISFIQWVKQPILKFTFIGLFSMAGVFTVFSYYKAVEAMQAENKEGGIGGYGEDGWIYSDLILSLKRDGQVFNKGIPVYSNASHAIYFFTKQHLAILPETKHIQDLQKFHQMPQNILIWLNNEDNPALETLEEIKLHKNLTILRQFKDGFIFLCTTK